MKNILGIIIAAWIVLISSTFGFAQKTDSTHFENKLGVNFTYSGLSVIESAVGSFHFTYTMKKHAVSLGLPLIFQGLFPGQNEWERDGLTFTYQYFPLRSNRLFSPFVFYGLHYSYSKSSRTVVLKTEDGNDRYGAVREATYNGLAHHFGVGVRCNFYKGLFLNLSVGAGPASFGQSVKLRSLQSDFADQNMPENPFSHYETALMFRIGIAYQVGMSVFKKGSKRCCD